MITYEDIIEKSFTHPSISDGRQTKFETPDLILSIVGGEWGLFGNFIDTFEIAIIDKKTKKFVTPFFYPEICENGDDVMRFVDKEKMLGIVNQIIK